MNILNNNLPEEIKFLGICEVPEDFSARYSCSSRMYKYFFLKELYNIEKMKKACGFFKGLHDFRNFCKIDVLNTTNYERTIFEIEIEQADKKVFSTPM